MNRFHETVADQRFLNKQIPMLINELGRMADVKNTIN